MILRQPLGHLQHVDASDPRRQQRLMRVTQGRIRIEHLFLLLDPLHELLGPHLVQQVFGSLWIVCGLVIFRQMRCAKMMLRTT